MSNTQSNSTNITKIVLYYGKEFEVPVDAKYIRTDSDGDVFTSTRECEPAYSVWIGLFFAGNRIDKVGSFNHTEMSSIDWMQSQKHIKDLPSVLTKPKTPNHPHADLMLKYAQIAQYSETPWEEFQLYNVREQAWVQNNSAVQFYPELEYRLKPQSVKPEVQVGQVWESLKSKGVFSVTSIVKAPYLKNIYIKLNLCISDSNSIQHNVTLDELLAHFKLVK